MLEYLFFNPEFADKFEVFLRGKQLQFERVIEAVQNATLITLSEDIDEALWDEIDTFYDALSDLDMLQLQESLVDDDKTNAAGIYIQLREGKQTIAKVDPEVMNKILETISMDEFNAFIEAIVQSVETPDESAFCKK